MPQKKILFLCCSILVLLSNLTVVQLCLKNLPIHPVFLIHERIQISQILCNPSKSNKISVVVSAFTNVLMRSSRNVITVNLLLIVSTPKVKNPLCLLLLQLRGFNHLRRLLTFHFVKRLSL